MTHDSEAANRAMDARLRYRILRVLESGRSVPFMRARFIVDTINGIAGGDHFEGDDHAVQLFRDLSGEGYIDLVDRRTLKSQGYGIGFLDVAIRPKGTRFLAGGEPADALIEDGRIV